MAMNGINPSAAASAYSNSQGITGPGQVTNIGKELKGIPGGESPIQNSAPSFADLIKGGVQDSIQSLKQGEEMSAKAITGEADITAVVQAVTQAELALQATVAVRDRMISAYQEIMRMPI